MSNVQLILLVQEGSFSVCRLSADARIPDWVPVQGLTSVTRTADELSIVCRGDASPDSAQAERDFRVLKIEGPLDFSLTGILQAVAGPLADADISIFALSTYDTDYVLIKQNDLEKAVSTLELAGHSIR